MGPLVSLAVIRPPSSLNEGVDRRRPDMREGGCCLHWAASLYSVESAMYHSRLAFLNIVLAQQEIVSITPKEMGFIFEGDFAPLIRVANPAHLCSKAKRTIIFPRVAKVGFPGKKAASDQKGKMILVWGSKRGCKHWLFLLLPSLPRWVAKFGGETTPTPPHPSWG